MSDLNYYKCYTQMMSRDDARKFREECMIHFGWAVTTFYVRLKGQDTVSLVLLRSKNLLESCVSIIIQTLKMDDNIHFSHFFGVRGSRE